MYPNLFVMKSARNSANHTKQYLDYLDKRWGKLTENQAGLPNLENEWEATQLQILLENVCSFYESGEYMVDEDPLLTTTTTKAAVTGGNMVPAVIPPIMRRVYPALMIRNLVNMQAIPTPEAKAFYYDALINDGADNYVRNDLKANYNKDYSDSAGEGQAIKKIKFQLTSTSIVAEAKKLMAQFSKELEQDLRVYTGLDARNESVMNISEQIALEIEGTVIGDLLANIPGGNNVPWVWTPPVGDVTTADKRAYAATLYEALIDADTLVYNQRYVNTNWIVADTATVARLRKLENFVISPTFNQNVMAVQRKIVGTLNNQWTVVQDPWFTTNKMILGYKNNSRVFHAGYVFAPYILAYMTNVFENPSDLTKAMGFMSRYAYKMLVPEMFATVSLAAA